jgi:hypothetical protein
MLPSVAFAQADSLKGFLEFFPLQNGDYWEYTSWSLDMYAEPQYDSSVFSVEVIGDTLLANGFEYKILHEKFIYPAAYIPDSSNDFERIDSSNGCVYVYLGRNYIGNGISTKSDEGMIDSLFAQPGDFFMSWWSTSTAANDYGTGMTCESIVNDTVLGMPTKVRQMSTRISLDDYGNYELAKGLGLFSQGDVWLGGAAWGANNLVYAKINGIEYGAKITALKNGGSVPPSGFALFQNYPNPFNPSTVISYQLPRNTSVTLEVYDALGRMVETLVNECQSAGPHSLAFSARGLPSGVYFYRLQAGSFRQTKKLMVIK